MGYVWDLVKALLGAIVVIVVLNAVMDGDLAKSQPFYYWGIWIFALVWGLGNCGRRHERNRKKQFVEEQQYEEALDAKAKRRDRP